MKGEESSRSTGTNNAKALLDPSQRHKMRLFGMTIKTVFQQLCLIEP